jgi:hypothetical protein
VLWTLTGPRSIASKAHHPMSEVCNITLQIVNRYPGNDRWCIWCNVQHHISNHPLPLCLYRESLCYKLSVSLRVQVGHLDSNRVVYLRRTSDSSVREIVWLQQYQRIGQMQIAETVLQQPKLGSIGRILRHYISPVRLSLISLTSSSPSSLRLC